MLMRRQGRAYRTQRPSLVALSHPSHAGWRLTPIVRPPAELDDRRMVQLAIRCHPCVPVSAEELEHWLEQQVEELRADAPRGTLRLSRLTQRAPVVELEIGWLVELELAEGERLLTGRGLADALRDMRLLGLQPTLLTPHETSTNGRAA